MVIQRLIQEVIIKIIEQEFRRSPLELMINAWSKQAIPTRSKLLIEVAIHWLITMDALRITPWLKR